MLVTMYIITIPVCICIVGSSHLHLVVSDTASHGPGFWGTYTDSPLVGLNFAEGE